VTAPIIGPRTREQVDGALRALEVKLDAETLAKIDAIFPGPASPPEAYLVSALGPTKRGFEATY
jgi:hypothetical protein